MVRYKSWSENVGKSSQCPTKSFEKKKPPESLENHCSRSLKKIQGGLEAKYKEIRLKTQMLITALAMWLHPLYILLQITVFPSVSVVFLNL